eukprot:tig00020806_g14051.t1
MDTPSRNSKRPPEAPTDPDLEARPARQRREECTVESGGEAAETHAYASLAWLYALSERISQHLVAPLSREQLTEAAACIAGAFRVDRCVIRRQTPAWAAWPAAAAGRGLAICAQHAVGGDELDECGDPDRLQQFLRAAVLGLGRPAGAGAGAGVPAPARFDSLGEALGPPARGCGSGRSWRRPSTRASSSCTRPPRGRGARTRPARRGSSPASSGRPSS